MQEVKYVPSKAGEKDEVFLDVAANTGVCVVSSKSNTVKAFEVKLKNLISRLNESQLDAFFWIEDVYLQERSETSVLSYRKMVENLTRVMVALEAQGQPYRLVAASSWREQQRYRAKHVGAPSIPFRPRAASKEAALELAKWAGFEVRGPRGGSMVDLADAVSMAFALNSTGFGGSLVSVLNKGGTTRKKRSRKSQKRRPLGLF